MSSDLNYFIARNWYFFWPTLGAIFEIVMSSRRLGLKNILESNHPFQGLLGILIIGSLKGLLIAWIIDKLFPSYLENAENLQKSHQTIDKYTFIYKMTKWSGYIFCIIYPFWLGWQLHQWFVTKKLYKIITLKLIFKVYSYVLKTPKAYQLFLPLVSIILFGIVFPAFGIKYHTIFIVSLVLFHTQVFLSQGVPPAVIFLSNSIYKSGFLLKDIKRGIYPYRIVYLLDPQLTQSYKKSSFDLDNFRTIFDKYWQEIVYSLTEIVPFIVLDTRIPSKGVIEEIEYIFRTGKQSKTIFIVGENGEEPALKRAKNKPLNIALRKVREKEVITILKELGLFRTTSPDDTPFLSKFGKRNQTKQKFHVFSYYELGVKYGIDGDFLRAKRNFEQSLKYEPSDMPSKECSKLADDALLQKIKNDAVVHFFKAIYHYDHGKLNNAIEEMKIVISIEPNCVRALTDLGGFYGRLEMPDKAIELFKEAIKIDSNYAMAHCNLAIAYSKKGEYELSCKHKNIAIELGYPCNFSYL
ncbi:MAG: tetratricopeptide repeat protein [Deltaproteobacteria bacterium]|nr:tetratricopeptide repeat protein [Deltaproteobacteria bacterium]